MDSKFSKVFLLALLGRYAGAAVLTAPPASITAAPVLKQRAVTTVGWISIGMSAGSTVWDAVTVNNEDHIIATSGSLFQICPPGILCEWFVCSDDWVVYTSSSVSCGGLTKTCSSYVLATDINDRAPLTNYWCDAITQTGGTIYITTPEGNDVIASPTTRNALTPTTAIATATSDPSDSETGIIASLPTSTSRSSSSDENNGDDPEPKSKSKTNIGAIAGGVIGGLVAIVGILVGIFFFYRKKKRSSQHPQPPHNQQQPQQGGYAPPPIQTQQTQQYYPPPQQPQQQQHTFYDPNAGAYNQSGYGNGAVSPMEKPGAQVSMYNIGSGGGEVSGPTSPAPGYSVPAGVNELPAQRN